MDLASDVTAVVTMAKVAGIMVLSTPLLVGLLRLRFAV